MIEKNWTQIRTHLNLIDLTKIHLLSPEHNTHLITLPEPIQLKIQEDENNDSSDKEDERKVYASLQKFCNERFAKITRKVHAGTTTLANTVHYNRLIFDSGADTSVIGRGWKIDSYYGPKINLVGFDSQWAKKKDLSICTADTILEHPHHNNC